ncbi:MAG: ROK family protein [Desulfurococcales archaeon]|nr:ROK family protein [Desulfurococcales archaeon]
MHEGLGRAVIAVDVGATNLRVGIFDLSASLLKVEVTRTPRSGGHDAVADSIKYIADNMLRSLGIRHVVGVGVGTIGPLNIREGVVVNTPNNPIRTFRLKAPLEEFFDVPAYVVNDCVAAVWGEFNAGSFREAKNMVYITLSTGIGAGVIVDGHLLLGKDGNAHEVGHITVNYKYGVRCGCGGIGHWEAIASGANIPKFAEEVSKNWHGSKTAAYFLACKGGLTPEDLFKHWRLGDEFATYVINELVEVNAAGLGSVINVYDPEVITLGGSIAINNTDFIEKVVQNVSKYAINKIPKISLTSLGEKAVLVGAAYLILNTPEELPKIQGSTHQ